jgi:hypothetical protein
MRLLATRLVTYRAAPDLDPPLPDQGTGTRTLRPPGTPITNYILSEMSPKFSMKCESASEFIEAPEKYYAERATQIKKGTIERRASPVAKHSMPSEFAKQANESTY